MTTGQKAPLLSMETAHFGIVIDYRGRDWKSISKYNAAGVKA